MTSVQIFFNDLTPEAQERVLEAAGLSSAEEANWDVIPLAVLDYEEEEEYA